jgi:hypothetical protein
MIERINERQLSDWVAIYKTPDSRLYQRLVEHGWMEVPDSVHAAEPIDELLFVWADEG